MSCPPPDGLLRPPHPSWVGMGADLCYPGVEQHSPKGLQVLFQDRVRNCGCHHFENTATLPSGNDKHTLNPAVAVHDTSFPTKQVQEGFTLPSPSVLSLLSISWTPLHNSGSALAALCKTGHIFSPECPRASQVALSL